MTLPTSGPLMASNINVELNVAATSVRGLNDQTSRRLCLTGTVNPPPATVVNPGAYIAYRYFYGASNEIPVDVVIVAGGGGGGGSNGSGGGGGGGGARMTQIMVIPLPGSSISVSVGGGGAGGSSAGSNGGQGGTSRVTYTSSAGTQSVTTIGGGGGGGGAVGFSSIPNSQVRAPSGGSGGGGSRYVFDPNEPTGSGANVVAGATLSNWQGGSGTSGQGNNGGNGFGRIPLYLQICQASGGGGGAGSSGGAASLNRGGNGGSGRSFNIGNQTHRVSGGGGGGAFGGTNTVIPAIYSGLPFDNGGGPGVGGTGTDGGGDGGSSGGLTAWSTRGNRPSGWSDISDRRWGAFINANGIRMRVQPGGTTDSFISTVTFPNRNPWIVEISSDDTSTVTMGVSSTNLATATGGTIISQRGGFGGSWTVNYTPPSNSVNMRVDLFNGIDVSGIGIRIYQVNNAGTNADTPTISAGGSSGYGSGGGGAGGGWQVAAGGRGTGGLVVLSYEGTAARATGGTITTGGNRVNHVFTGSGALRWS